MKDLKLKLEQATQRARTLKTKRAQLKAWTVVREIRNEIVSALYDQVRSYGTHSVKATVRWFHEGDDYVALNTPYGTLYASPTSDAVSKSWYGHTCCVSYVEGQQVIVEIDVDVDLERLCLELIPKRIYGGMLDEVRYAELCKRTDLAFFRYPTGEMSGLFGGGK